MGGDEGWVSLGSWQRAAGSGQLAVGSWQWAVGSGQLAVGSWQWAVGGGQAAVESWGRFNQQTLLDLFFTFEISNDFNR